MGWPVFFDDFFSNIRIIGIFIWIILLSLNLFGLKYVSSAGMLFLILVIMGILMGIIGFSIPSNLSGLEM